MIYINCQKEGCERPQQLTPLLRGLGVGEDCRYAAGSPNSSALLRFVTVEIRDL